MVHLPDAAALTEHFHAAEPFPHLVIDDFLDEAFAERLLAEFPGVDAMPKSGDYIFGDKRQLPNLESGGSAGADFRDFLLGDEFRNFVSTLWGHPLFIDPTFHGGGFHQGGDGSFLDMHADFNMHPQHPTWHRMLNVLLYLNRGWKPEWDGRLLITADLSKPPKEVEPLFNRLVIMETSERTYHGYRRMSLPTGVTRKSVAAYAYELVTEGAVKPRTTVWKPTSNSLLKRAVARYWVPAARLRNRLRATNRRD